MLTGLITIFPLICFANAARRLKLTTLGFLQYLAPTENFIIGVLVFGEEITMVKMSAFAMIWIALAVYSYDTWRWSKRTRLEQQNGVQPTIPEG